MVILCMIDDAHIAWSRYRMLTSCCEIRTMITIGNYFHLLNNK